MHVPYNSVDISLTLWTDNIRKKWNVYLTGIGTNPNNSWLSLNIICTSIKHTPFLSIFLVHFFCLLSHIAFYIPKRADCHIFFSWNES